MSELKPVVFRIELDTTEAMKQLDALNRGGGKGTPGGKGVPQAPKPESDAGGRVPGEAPGARFAPGRGGGIVPGAPGASTGGGGARFASGLGAINRAVLNPAGTAEGIAARGVGGALGTVGAAAGIVVGTATLLEQVLPLILESLARSLPDMPFFSEWRKAFDEISDWITEKRVTLEAIIGAFGETAQIASARLQFGDRPEFGDLVDVGLALKDIRVAQGRFEADVAKERNKDMFHNLMRALAEGI